MAEVDLAFVLEERFIFVILVLDSINYDLVLKEKHVE